MTTRVTPPASGLYPVGKGHGGRTYTCALGSYLDVPDGDAWLLATNGWTSFGLVGATAARPVSPAIGTRFYDTTLSLSLKWDGLVWRANADGTAV